MGQSVSEQVRASVDRFYEVSEHWGNDAPGSVIEFEGSVLERTPNSAGRNPYLVISVSEDLQERQMLRTRALSK